MRNNLKLLLCVFTFLSVPFGVLILSYLAFYMQSIFIGILSIVVFGLGIFAVIKELESL